MQPLSDIPVNSSESPKLSKLATPLLDEKSMDPGDRRLLGAIDMPIIYKSSEESFFPIDVTETQSRSSTGQDGTSLNTFTAVYDLKDKEDSSVTDQTSRHPPSVLSSRRDIDRIEHTTQDSRQLNWRLALQREKISQQCTKVCLSWRKHTKCLIYFVMMTLPFPIWMYN